MHIPVPFLGEKMAVAENRSRRTQCGDHRVLHPYGVHGRCLRSIAPSVADDHPHTLVQNSRVKRRVIGCAQALSRRNCKCVKP